MDSLTVEKINDNKCLNQPQCQYFVKRKKRLCRMTVRPGRNYCGEHEPQPKIEEGKEDDMRIPCPYDPKHTCYASKLAKHLSICNARQGAVPAYIVHNINAPAPAPVPAPRAQLAQFPPHKIAALIDKVNILYDKYVKDTISTVDEQPIHDAVKAEFSEAGRMESSLRHLRQASSLLHIIEAEGLVQKDTCYVELGAGKGQLGSFAHAAWCGAGSRLLLVDRAALRHKRDGRLRAATRLRADLAHLALERVPQLAPGLAVVAFAKHLCGVATDYALRCVANAARARRVGGLVLATCCHHRCEPAAYVGAVHLQEMGITEEDLSIMLGVVSWATCGEARAGRARAGRRARALLELGRVRFLRERGFRARLCRFVPPHVSPENLCIVATRP